MKALRIRLARWLARRDELKARNQRRALRDHNRHEETACLRRDRRARGRRLYAGWLAAPHTSYPSYTSHSTGVSLDNIRAVLSTISFRRAA